MIYFILVPITLFMLIYGIHWLRRPSNEGDWKPEFARMPKTSLEGHRVVIKHVRNARYGEPGTPYEVTWEERSYDLRKLKRLWYVVEPFRPRLKAIAHTFLSFEFEDDFLAFSVEARTKVGQRYSIFKGLVGEFELIYSYGDERDFMLRRVKYQQHQLFLYPLLTPPEDIRQLLVNTLLEANRQHERPRFYHSIFENCTSVLKDHANRLRPGSFPPFMMAQILPGSSARVLLEKGWIDTKASSIEQARAIHDVSKKALRYQDAPDFSRRIREGLAQE